MQVTLALGLEMCIHAIILSLSHFPPSPLSPPLSQSILLGFLSQVCGSMTKKDFAFRSTVLRNGILKIQMEGRKAEIEKALVDALRLADIKDDQLFGNDQTKLHSLFMRATFCRCLFIVFCSSRGPMTSSLPLGLLLVHGDCCGCVVAWDCKCKLIAYCLPYS